MSDIAVTTQPAEVKPLVDTHVPHENGTAVAPQAEAVPVAPVNITPVEQPVEENNNPTVMSEAPKETTQNTEDVDLDIDVESKPDLRKDQASESKQEEYDEESDSDSDSLDLADLDIDLDNIDALDINELQKKQQALLELRNKKQRKLEELLRKQNDQLHNVMPTAAESMAAQYTSQPAGSMSPYPGKRGRGRPRKVPRPGDPEEVILAHLQQQKLKLQQQIQQQQQQLAQAGVDLSQLNALHGSPDYEKKAKERALWTLQESRQLLKILESGKTDPQQIWDELSATIGNTKTFDQVKNKKANLMQKASSKSMTVIDVLKDDIVKLEGELFGFSSESDNEAGSFTSSKRRKVNEAGEYYVPAGSPPIVPSSPGLMFDHGGKRGPGRPRKYARAEDGSVIKQKPLVLPPVETAPVSTTSDIRSFLSHKFEEVRAAREEDRRIIERQRKIMENMQHEIKYLKFTNQLLLEKFDIDPAAQEERFKKILEGEQSREENHSNHNHSPEHGHTHTNTNAMASSDSQPKSDAMEEEPKTDAMKIE
eukprot:TRINITY_DN2411_c0_g1_i1.p1 TRINITY_DN2411_c0_g1~~TRINITY_DN2411_c0_g1_i1.p1  ORF type:complete len:538 (+),score=134.29 TRINITY_DN2411_c0_g1_i1:95-1708(+)